MSYGYQMDKQYGDEQQCDLLVQVSGKYLQLNGIVLDKLNKLCTDNVPVVIFSILGQPKSNKTSLMNYVLRVIAGRKNFPTYQFPLSSNDEYPTSKCFRGLQGILIHSFYSSNVNDGSTSIWLLLDIWMEDPVEEVYNKLVDFCLNISSKIIYLPQVSYHSFE